MSRRVLARATIFAALGAKLACTGGAPFRPAAPGSTASSASNGANASNASGAAGAASGDGSAPTLTGQAGTLPQGKARIVPIASDAWVARDVLTLTPESTLYVGQGGERWLATTKGGAPATLDAAAQLAPEDLLAVRKGPGGLRFLGRSGAVYEAKDALAPFTGERKAPTTMRLVAAGSAAFVGVGVDGALRRTLDGGATWTPVSLPKHLGVLAQLSFAHDGTGLALIAPQQLLATKDDGASFAPVAVPDAGAYRLGLTKEDVPYVDGMAMTVASDGGVSWSTNGPKSLLRFDATGPSLAVAKVTPRETKLPLGDAPAYLSYAGVFNDGQGALVGDAWLEVEPGMSDDESEPLDLSIAQLAKAGAPVKTIRIPGLDHCISSGLAVSGKRVVVGCAHDEDEKGTPRSVLLLARSDDLGVTWKSAGKLGLDPSSPPRHLYLGPRGELVADGVCLAANAPCAGGGLVHVGEGGKLTKVSFAGKHAELQRLVFAEGGDRVFATAVIDDGNVALLRSKDGGRSFLTTTIPAVGDDAASDTADLAVFEEEGKRTLVLHAFGGDLLRFVSRDDGVTLQGQPSPLAALDVELVSLAGKRGLALASGRAFETRDAGASFAEIKLPPPRWPAEWPNIVCSASGCLIGERAFRAGWELDGDADLSTLVPAAAPKKSPMFATPIVCHGDGALSPLGFVDTIVPDPSPAFAWSTVARDVETNAVTVIAQPRPAKSLSPKSTPLLPALDGEAAIATTSRPEGVTALRYRVARKAAANGAGKPPLVPKQTVDVELAWWDAQGGATHKATLKGLELDAAKYVALESSGILRARASAWIVAGGLYVRPFATKGSEPLYFVSDAGKATLLPTPSPLPPIPLTAFRSAGSTLFVGVGAENLGGRQIFLAALAKDAGATWTTRILGAWPHSDASPSMLARVVATAGAGPNTGPIVQVAWPGDATIPAASFGLALHGSDAVGASELFELPTLDALGEPPRACTADPSATRLELPWSTGKRRPILVTGAKTFTRASTDVHARIPKKGAPCAAAIATAAYPNDDQLLVFPDAPDLAVHFASTTTKGLRVVTATPLKCRFDASAKLPSSMSSTKGFVSP